jgi:hypothetical protein
MLKMTIIFIMSFMMALTAGARSYIRSYEDFVHLSDSEKDQLIVKTMELAIELEARYKKEVAVSGFNQERFEKYTKALNQISALFINSAFAADAKSKKDWFKMGQDFVKLLEKPNSRCIFAGWVSQPSKDSSGTTVCSHPGFLKGATEKDAYPDPAANSDCKKNDRKKIECSPVLFGYKKETDKSLFCVDASDGAHNSSYNCMKAALAEGAEQKGDSKEERLKNLRDRLAKNPEIFKGVQEFVYKTCVCEDTDKKINFSPEYHKYMRPHRTCYGLMEMMGETTMCEDPKIIIDTSIFKSLRDFARNKTVSNDSADSFYTEFVNNEVKKTAPAEYNRLCGANLTVEDPNGKRDGSSDGDGSNPDDSNMPKVHVTGTVPYECTATCKPGAAQKKPEAAEDDEAESEGEKDKAEKTDKAETPAAAAYTCSFNVSKGKKKDIKLDSEPSAVPKSASDKELPIQTIIGGKPVDIKCDLTIEEADEPKPEEDVDLVLEVQKETKNYIVTAKPKNQGDWVFKWKIDSTKELKVKRGWEVEGPQKNKTEARAGLAKPTEEKEEDKKPEPKEKEETPKPEEKSDNLVTTQERLSATYKVCGELSKPGQKTISKCENIDPVGATPTPSTAPNRGPVLPANAPPIQMPPAMDSSFSLQGIQ